MRKLKGLLLTFCFSVIMITASVNVVCAEKIAYEDGKRVYDLADLFANYEEDNLTEKILETEDSIETEIYIITRYYITNFFKLQYFCYAYNKNILIYNCIAEVIIWKNSNKSVK